jgi:hypothetical protein
MRARPVICLPRTDASRLSPPHPLFHKILPQDRPGGRPGLNPLRYDVHYRVNATDFEALRKLNENLKLMGVLGGSGSTPTLSFVFPPSGPSGNYGTYVTFEQSDKPGVFTTADTKDLAALTNSIRDASYFADYIVTSIHAHEGAPGQVAGSVVIPAQFIGEYAHAAIDAGADVFVGSGPHVLRGIEIYKGKVIFYSLGNFITENWLNAPEAFTMYDRYNLGLAELPSVPHNARSDFDRKDEPSWPLYWQSAVAHVVFRDGSPAEVKLTPVTLGFGYRTVNRGWPEIAQGVEATRILEHLQRLSEPYGTKITISSGVGTITIPK